MAGVLDELLEGTGFYSDGYGDYDSNLVCEEDGTMIEMDAEACPECGAKNPLRAQGMI